MNKNLTVLYSYLLEIKFSVTLCQDTLSLLQDPIILFEHSLFFNYLDI